MADVNPNQDLRFKEIMKRVIPGAYFFSYIFIVWKLVTTEPIYFQQQLSNVTNNVNDGVEVAYGYWLLILEDLLSIVWLAFGNEIYVTDFLIVLRKRS